MRVLVFGANGQVGRELLHVGPVAGVEIAPFDRAALDITREDAVRRVIDLAAPDAIINAAAYTAVDKAESERDSAMRVNGAAPGVIAQAAAEAGVPFIHLSTDYVFDGEGARPYRESDAPRPVSVYGETKLEGERRVAAAGGIHAIIRTSWIFSPHGSNFVKTMLRLGRERSVLRVVADQRGKPTPAAGVAVASIIAAKALREDAALAGVYHLAGDEETVWADFAAAIMKAAGLSTRVEKITTAEYPTASRRPAYSVLDTAKFEKTFGVAAPSWRLGLDEAVAVLAASEEKV